MDDYHEVWIEEWWLYWSPNYVSIIRGTIVVPNATPTIFGGSLANTLVLGTLDLPFVGKKSCVHLTSYGILLRVEKELPRGTNGEVVKFVGV